MIAFPPPTPPPLPYHPFFLSNHSPLSSLSFSLSLSLSLSPHPSLFAIHWKRLCRRAHTQLVAVRERFYVAAYLSIGNDAVVKQLYGVVGPRNRYIINSIVIAGQSDVSWLLFAVRVYNESALRAPPRFHYPLPPTINGNGVLRGKLWVDFTLDRSETSEGVRGW